MTEPAYKHNKMNEYEAVGTWQDQKWKMIDDICALEETLGWYQEGSELLQPLRFHLNELLEVSEHREIPGPSASASARVALEKVEDFFVRKGVES